MPLIFLSILSLITIFLPLLYSYVATNSQARLPTLRNKRICLLIAHPDDEAMFFAPTVLALTRPETGNHVKILCLSTGDADGLGETRKRELTKSAMMLGLRQEDDVFVVERPSDFPDSMTTPWDPLKISTLLSSAFAPALLRPTSPSAANPIASIDVLLTFDAHGVSSHPNHISLYHGARRFISALTAGRPSTAASPVDLYTLTTVNVVRKYSSFLDMFSTLATLLASGSEAKQKSAKGNPGILVNLSGLFTGRESAATARRAMTDAHQSQMAWFRWGWITLSRYMVINELRLEPGES
ncbi:putative deacetylase LmbE-like domain-containing protein [Xylariales sp. PMI_506]|nr:putative deacetylase LmbE-like domain-containing protein [Xylariales sp. PMI_506]